MIINFKQDQSRRSVLFENLAKLLIRKEKNNNFIFITRNFNFFNEIVLKYKLNIKELNPKIIELFEKRITSVDLIEFKLKDKYSRIVNEIILYEVKTKISNNKYRYDICLSSFETYHKAQVLNIETKLISFVLFENWRYSFNIHDLDLSKYNVYSKALKNRYEAKIKANLILKNN